MDQRSRNEEQPPARYVCYVLFIVVCQNISWQSLARMLSLTSTFLGCVFHPALISSWVGVHTVCAFLVWEWNMLYQLSRELTICIAFGSRCMRSAPGKHSLRKVLPPAFPAVRLWGSNCGARRWIRQREWRQAPTFLLL